MLFEGKPVDVISINKTRLDNTIDDPEMKIPGYDLFRKDRSRNGGGVALYVRNVFNTINKTHTANVYLEAVRVEILKPKAKPILIATVYRPPNSGSDYMNNLECFLHELDNNNKEIIFTGDLNCDFLSDVHQAHTHKLTELLNVHQLEQVITDPTRITCNSESLIDILATNKLDKLLNCGVLHVGISNQSCLWMF